MAHRATHRGAHRAAQKANHGATTVVVPTPAEAQDGAQLTTFLGFGSEQVWKWIYDCNEASGNLHPNVGTFSFVGSAGVIQGEAGPLDSFDKSVRSTDGDTDGQWTGTNGELNVGSASFAMLCEFKLTAIPANNRSYCGEDGTHDILMQAMSSTGRVRVALIGGSTVTSEIAVNHADSNWHTALIVCDRSSANQVRIATDLGASTAASVAALGSLTADGAPFLLRNNAAPPGSIAFWAFALSDGSSAQNTAIADLFTNITTAVSNYRTATGR